MAHELLATYLNDHLAGSVVALRLMETLESSYEGTDIASMVKSVRVEVEHDRGVLEEILARVDASESTTRKAAGWLAERVSQLKFGMDDTANGPLRLLESAEVVALGILGKRALWRALESSQDLLPSLQGLDYPDLIRRAESQHDLMDLVRIGAARAAFHPA